MTDQLACRYTVTKRTQVLVAGSDCYLQYKTWPIQAVKQSYDFMNASLAFAVCQLAFHPEMITTELTKVLKGTDSFANNDKSVYLILLEDMDMVLNINSYM